MLIRRPDDLPSSEITPYQAYLDRRRFLGTLTTGAVASALGPAAFACGRAEGGTAGTAGNRNGSNAAQDELTPYEDITHYNNFYEFGTGKEDPARNAQNFRTQPWTVEVEGHVKKTGVYALEDLLRPFTLEDRVYRLRCVEAWSMVIPWRGFPLRDLIRRFEPTSQAKYLEFVTLYDPEQMPEQRRPILDWPYNEGLRMDEALHPLTLMVTGLYGRELPNQNGAPFRLVVPWKYGFKGIKSIVKIRFVEDQPRTTWMKAGPNEYGFYANVNPNVDHPRWSQKRERRIGEWRKRETLMFNGYADQVASLYEGMDLRKYF